MQESSVCSLQQGPYDPARINLMQQSDPDLIQLILYLEQNVPYSSSVSAEISEHHMNDDGRQFKHADYEATAPLVVPIPLRSKILIQNHDCPLPGHFGFDTGLRHVNPAINANGTILLKQCHYKQYKLACHSIGSHLT